MIAVGQSDRRDAIERRRASPREDDMKTVYAKPTLTKAKVTLQSVTSTLVVSGDTKV